MVRLSTTEFRGKVMLEKDPLRCNSLKAVCLTVSMCLTLESRANSSSIDISRGGMRSVRIQLMSAAIMVTCRR